LILHNISVNPAARLYVILARKSPIGVVFRRGPSKCVQLIKWNTSNNSFEHGQWLKGRIYERRSDLSPSGDLLLYFAAKHKAPIYSWSAISRPPFLTALAFWPNLACWGGGGHFLSDESIALNHGEGAMLLGEGYSLPRSMRVQPFGANSGRGEDDPVWSMRLQRDGWTQVEFPIKTKDDFGQKVWYEFDPPIKWHKFSPKSKYVTLEMSILGVKERDGPWHIIEHNLLRRDGTIDKIGRSDWADWSHSGDLLFAQGACLFRVPYKGGVLSPIESCEQIADFSHHKFEAFESPEIARRWPKR
jgi:hypothetical protein